MTFNVVMTLHCLPLTADFRVARQAVPDPLLSLDTNTLQRLIFARNGRR
jgi:hypothetical protein